MGNWREWVIRHSKMTMAGSIVLGIAGIILFNVVEQVGAFMVLFGVIGVIVTAKVAKPPKEKAASQRGQRFDVVKNDSPVILKPGETVYLNYPAVRYITKHRVVGKTAGIAGASMRLGGVSIRGGGIQGHSIWGDVVGTFYGNFTLTNRRVVFVAEQNGYECNLSNVSAITQGDSGVVVIATPQYTYNMHLIQSISPGKMKKLQAGKKEKLPVIADAYQILMGLISDINSTPAQDE